MEMKSSIDDLSYPHWKSLFDHMGIITDIFRFAQKCHITSKRIHEKNIPNKSDAFNKYESLRLFYVISARTAAIELSMLLISKGNKYNFTSLINGLLADEYGKTFKTNPDLIKWQFRIEENQPKIQKMTKLRDSVFAHTDNTDKISKLDKLEYEDVDYLFDFCYELLQSLQIILLDATINISTNTDSIDEFLIKLNNGDNKQ